jgi:hypothetical protein
LALREIERSPSINDAAGVADAHPAPAVLFGEVVPPRPCLGHMSMDGGGAAALLLLQAASIIGSMSLWLELGPRGRCNLPFGLHLRYT